MYLAPATRFKLQHTDCMTLCVGNVKRDLLYYDIVIVNIENALSVITRLHSNVNKIENKVENKDSLLGDTKHVSTTLSYHRQREKMCFCARLCNLNSFHLVDYQAQQCGGKFSMRNDTKNYPSAVFYLYSSENFNFVNGKFKQRKSFEKLFSAIFAF